MIANRWMIPVGFGVVCVALGITSSVLSSRGIVKNTEAGFQVGDSHVWEGLALKKDQRYTLFVRPTSGVMLNSQVVVSATLSRDGAEVFTVEDAYWHERGVWREGGESGTWEEQNSSSQFSFLVPEDGAYDLEFTLESATSIAGDRLQMTVEWREPWVFRDWPFFVGALLLFGLGIHAHLSRRGVLGRFLETVGEGTRFKIGDHEYTVISRTEHWEPPQRVGVEFRLRDAQGKERWLAVERYWREHPYIEDGEQTLVQTLIDVEMDDDELARLSAHDSKDSFVTFRDEFYNRDRDNEGSGRMVTIREGRAYVGSYWADVFRDEVKFPQEPGDVWIECITWRGKDAGEVEWGAMQLIDTDLVDIIEMKAAESYTWGQIEDMTGGNDDPFGVSELRGKARQGLGTVPAQQKQEQQQQNAGYSVDWNS